MTDAGPRVAFVGELPGGLVEGLAAEAAVVPWSGPGLPGRTDVDVIVAASVDGSLDPRLAAVVDAVAVVLVVPPEALAEARRALADGVQDVWPSDLPAPQSVAALHHAVARQRYRAQRLGTLDESGWFLKRAQEVGEIGSWISDPSDAGRLIWSDETCRIFGLEPGEFDGRVETFFAMVHPDDLEAVRRASTAAIRGERAYEIAHRIVRPDGTVRHVLERAEVVRASSGEPLRMLGVVQDVTRRHELEERLRQGQKMEALGRLAGGVAHDFNNLLTVVLGEGGMLLERIPASGSLRRHVEEMVAAAQRLASLTQQLLAFSRRQVLRPQLLDLVAAVNELAPMLERLLPREIALETRLEPTALVNADPTQLQQVVLNLVLNARDAMPAGGRIEIEVTAVSVEVARPSGLPAGRWVRLAISDTGSGIPHEIQRHVFEPFYTTKSLGKGTGLGLATVYGIVEQSGGHLGFESEPGMGSRFEVYLPEVASPGPARPTAARPGETVLLVDDEDAVRALARETLEAAGYAVVATRSPESALQLLERETADLLVTDVVMPGMSGVELAQRAREQRPGLEVLFVSGYSPELVEGHGPGGGELLAKPFSAEGLRRKVRELLDRRNGGP